MISPTLKAVSLGVALAGVAVVAYSLGARNRAPGAPETSAAATPAPVTASPPAPAPPPAPVSQASVAMPAGHPPLPGTVGPEHDPDARFTQFRVGNRNVKAILADTDHVWIGTSGGVIRYDPATGEHRLFDVRTGLLSNGVFHLSKLGSRLAVGTYGGGLSLLEPAALTWSNYNIQHGLADAFVYDLLETESGDLWIATWSGANRVRGGKLDDRSHWDTFTVENTAGGLPNDWVYGLAAGADGVVWIATEGGLARFDGKTWQNWRHEDGLGAPYEQVRDQIQFTRDPAKESTHHARQKIEQGLANVDIAYNPNYIVSLHVDASGAVWAGTWGGGLSRFDGTAWRTYTVDDGLPGNHVFMLRAAGEGRMWVGTSNGLALFDGDRFEAYTTSDGLYADNVFSLARDTGGSVWVGSFGGVARIEGLGL